MVHELLIPCLCVTPCTDHFTCLMEPMFISHLYVLCYGSEIVKCTQYG